jgi:hypothetical protein
LNATFRGDLKHEIGPGLIVSLLLHLFAVLLVLFFVRSALRPPGPAALVVPVDVVRLGEETTSPPQPQRSAVPQQRAARTLAKQTSSFAASPRGKNPPTDELEAKLRALAKLRQPDSKLPLLANPGISDVTATSNGATPGQQAAYSVRDYIRAQVERRWSLDVGALGTRNFLVAIHLVLARDGSVTKAEIVDKARYGSDATYRETRSCCPRRSNCRPAATTCVWT